MTAPNTRHPQSSNRIPRPFSFPEREERRRDGLLRGAWMRIVQGFICRPSPRSPWDETATGDTTPWRTVVGPIRTAIASALFIGNAELTEQTIEAACEWCDQLKADFRSMAPQRETESVQILALLETDCAGEARKEEMALVISPTPTEAERAILPLAREVDALARVLSWAERCARQPQMQRHA